MKKQNWIQRAPKSSNDRYTIVDNNIIRSQTLTMNERGLLIYLLSLPSDWRVRKTEVQTHMTGWSRRDYEKAFKGLVEKGHIHPHQLYERNLKNGVVYFVFETPYSGNTGSGIAETDTTEGGILQNTEEQITEKQNKEKQNKEVTGNELTGSSLPNRTNTRTTTEFDLTDKPPLEVQEEIDRFFKERGLL